MWARAPGKAVLSGAYAILWGGPALVGAVSRFVVADGSRAAAFRTPEVDAALGAETPAPWFDASALRNGDKKLGLGSSAAILVASLAVRDPVAAGLGARLLERAVCAHRQAQGGGSGIDVAAACLGGTLGVRLGAELELHGEAICWPEGLQRTLLDCGDAASTPSLLGAVKGLATTHPDRFSELMGAQLRASERAYAAAVTGQAADLAAALAAQCQALRALGEAAAVPIVLDSLWKLAPAVAAAGGALLPAGAGGGDIALLVWPGPTPASLKAELAQAGLHPIPDCHFEAPGVQHCAPVPHAS